MRIGRPRTASLHAAVLARVEAVVELNSRSGHSDAAIGIAQAMLAVDPTADAIELGLLRVYRAAGRHAAAAEQYAHYASVLRDQLGVDAPRIEDL